MDQSVRKEQLMKEFLGSVKACQIKYSGGRELATEADPRVRCVCASVEQLLCHGVRPAAVPTASQSTIRQVTEYVSAGLQLGLSGGDPNSSNSASPPAKAAWGFLCCQLTPHEGSRFLQLRRVSCDTGRLRAWVRSALNERSLERYIRMICSEIALLQRWFEPWALLRDASHTATLPSLAQGLGGIFFALAIDKAELCSSAQCPQHSNNSISGAKEEQPGRAAHLLASLPRSKSKDEGLSSAALKKREYKRRRKKVPSQLVSFDEDSSCGVAEEATEDSPLWVQSAPTTCLNSPALAAGATPCQDTLHALATAAAASSANKAKRQRDHDGFGDSGRGGHSLMDKNTRDGHEALLQRILDDRSNINNRLGSSNSSLVSYSDNFIGPSHHRRSKSDVDASRLAKHVLIDRPFINSSSRTDDCHTFKPFPLSTNCDNSSCSREKGSFNESKGLKEIPGFCNSVSCSNNDQGGRQATSPGRSIDSPEDYVEDVEDADLGYDDTSSSVALAVRDYVRSESSYSAVLEELLEAHGGSDNELLASEFNNSSLLSSTGLHDTSRQCSPSTLDKNNESSWVDVTSSEPSSGHSQNDASASSNEVRSENNELSKTKENPEMACPVTVIKTKDKSCSNVYDSKKGNTREVSNDAFSSPHLIRVIKPGKMSSDSDSISPSKSNAKEKSHDYNGYNFHQASSARQRHHLDSSSSECDSPVVVSLQPDPREALGTRADLKANGPDLGPLHGVLKSEAGSDLDFGSYKSSLSNLSVGSALSSDADGGATVTATSYVVHHETGAGATVVTRGLPAPSPCSSLASASSGSGTRTAEQLVPSSLTRDELRAAVLALSRSREVSDRRRRAAEARAEAAETECEAARREIEDSKLRSETRQRETEARLEALQRENSLLRKQLGKYISAVQLLKRNNTSDCSSDEATFTAAGTAASSSITPATGTTTASKTTAVTDATDAAATRATSCDGVSVPASSAEGIFYDAAGARVRPPAFLPPPPKFHDYHTEAAAYESKLVQVAEMHGELFEFSERLQRIIRVRERQISALRIELESLRGPLPEDASLEQQLQRLQHQHQQHSSDETDTVSLCSTDVLGGGGLVSVAPPLINVWIPSAFLVGGGAWGPAAARGGDQHHVYQVFVRIRDDEWTVFRRFAHFHQLHKQLSRTYPTVRCLSFPQKKPFGYKEESVVTARRVALQEYLRHVVNILLRSSPQLAAAPDRCALTALLPFLAEETSGGGGSSSIGGPTRQVLALPQYSGL